MGAAPSLQNSKFELVKDPEEAKNMLQEATKEAARASIWIKGNREKAPIETTIHFFNAGRKALYVSLPRGFSSYRFMASLNELKTRECLFSVNMSRAHIFFSCAF